MTKRMVEIPTKFLHFVNSRFGSNSSFDFGNQTHFQSSLEPVPDYWLTSGYPLGFKKFLKINSV
jgi:hypothetical protein